MLAGVSVEHYTRIEQGRGVRASAQVLDAIATALAMSDPERAHLHDLAAPAPAGPRPARRRQRVAQGLARLIEQLDQHPAVVLGRRMDVLAWNPLAAQLLGDFANVTPKQRNMARLVFLDQDTIALYPDWEKVARETVAFLRRDSAHDLEDPQLAELIGELSLKSESFGRWWNSREVKDKVSGIKRFNHPSVGELELEYQTFVPAAAEGQALVIYTAEPQSRSQTALQLLATLASTEQASEVRTHPARTADASR